MSARPPRLAEWLLSRLLPRSLGEEAVEELRHGWELRVERDGVRAADRWYWWEVPGFLIRLWLGARSLETPATRSRIFGRSAGMTSIPRDVRQALRGLRRTPGFTVVALLTVALGIGANAVIFSVVRAVLLRPLPFPAPERLVELSESRLDRGWTSTSFTYANFWDVRDQNRTFDAIGALTPDRLNLTGDGYPRQLSGARVSADFFRALGAAPVLGRTFAPGEDEESANRNILVLSNALWRELFGGERDVIGRELRLNGESYTVIGVLPAGEPWLDAAEVFVPLAHTVNPDRGSFELAVVGRLKPGVTTEEAAADLKAIAERLASLYPEQDRGMGIVIDPSSSWVADDGLRRALWVLMGGVGLLLVIACVNLANLLLAKATGRARERALRAALGASHTSLAANALVESLVVVASGTVIGLIVAAGGLQLIRVLQPGTIPRLGEASLDGGVLLFTAAIAIGTAIVTGLVPALRTPHSDLVSALREGERSVSGSRRQSRLRGLLVGVEVAVSLMLLVGAGLLLRSFREVMRVDRGFATDNRLFAAIALDAGYDADRTTQFLRQYIGRIETLPEVSAAAAINFRPLRGVGVGMGYAAPDRPAPAEDAVPWSSWRLITPHYFEAMGVPVVAGREFNETDRVGDPWRVIISRRIADELWANENAVGRTLTLWKGQTEIPAEVIGVVDDMRDQDLEAGLSRAVYIPYYGAGWSAAQLIVHGNVPPTTLLPKLRAILGELDPNLPMSDVRTFDAMLGQSVAARRFLMLMLVCFAGVALLLALGGVYGVLSWSVARRRSEIGMRLALGSQRARVLRMILFEGMRPVVIGLAAGIAGALAITRIMSSLLFDVSHLDALTYIGTALMLATTAAVSCYLPARRATSVDVMTALRDE